MLRDVTLLIQGPLDATSLDNLAYYKTLCESVVISYWEGGDESLFETHDVEDCILTKHKTPQKRYYREDTFDYQAQSILNGLEVTKTKYVIRTRADERWGNLSLLVAKWFENQEKIVCGNIFFKRWDVFRHHFGDHLFIGSTDVLHQAYKTIRCDPNRYRKNLICAEAIGAMAIMDAMRDDQEREKEAFKECFDVVDINSMTPFVARYRHAKVTYNDQFSHAQVITSMEEL